MTFGEKLSKLRKSKNYTQEQLAELLGVSRQSISKWESDSAYPETDKLIRLSELFGCSLDYLLRDGDAPAPTPAPTPLNFRNFYYEKKSRTTVHGIPLVHINIGYGRTAKGIIAIGLAARGVVAIGLLSLGVLSIGLLSLGVLAFGLLALGILAAGTISVGVVSFGAISIGLAMSFGAIAIGDFAVGALALGRHFAYGAHAEAMIAVGKDFASGELFAATYDLTPQDIAAVRDLLDAYIPSYLRWASAVAKLLLNVKL